MTTPKFLIAAAGLLLLPLAPGLSRADLTVEESTIIKGLPLLGDATSQSTTAISGDKERQATTSEFKSRLARMFVGQNSSAEIVRLDKELIWSLNEKDKTYTEMTFAQMGEMIAQAADAMKGMPQAQQQPDAAKMDWKVDVKRTGQKKDILGHNTEEAVITMTGTAKDEKSGETITSRWVMDGWFSKTTGDLAELEAFGKRFAEKMGTSPEFGGGMARALAPYSDQLAKISKEMEGLGGYPLESHLSMQVQAPPPDTTKTKSTEAATEEQKEDNSTPTSVEGAKEKAMKSALGGMFGKKKEKEKPAPQASADGFTTVFQMDMSVDKISPGAVPGESFEIPAGYKKTELKMPKKGE